MKNKTATIEYKETEVFELFPDYEYTRQQRRRLILFHAYAKNAKKIIRYAKNFDAPNRICLVYIVGTPKETVIRDELSSCSNRVCVLTSEFPNDGHKLYAEFVELRKSLLSVGEWDKEKNEPNEKYYQFYDFCKASLDDNAPDNQLSFMADYDFVEEKAKQYAKELDLITRYNKLKADCKRKYFKNWRLWRNGCLTKPYTHARLDELIRRIFPNGGEAIGLNDYALGSPAAIQYFIKGEFPKRANVTPEMVEDGAAYIVKHMKREIESKGYCNLIELSTYCALPPFGFAYDGFSAACFYKAFAHFGNRTLIYYDDVCDFSQKEIDCVESAFEYCFSPAMSRKRERREHACVYLESQPHKKVKRFLAELWGIKIEMPGTRMGLHLREQLCKTHRVPLSYVDERLLHLTLWDVNFWDRREVERIAEEIERNGDEIKAAYQRYLSENANIPKRVANLVTPDYSWAWTGETYEDMLWATEKYGPWMWDNETQRKVNAELEQRRKERKATCDALGVARRL